MVVCCRSGEERDDELAESFRRVAPATSVVVVGVGVTFEYGAAKALLAERAHCAVASAPAGPAESPGVHTPSDED